MHEKLKEYFEKAEEEENKLTAQELISAGLYEKEYSEKNEFSYVQLESVQRRIRSGDQPPAFWPR